MKPTKSAKPKAPKKKVVAKKAVAKKVAVKAATNKVAVKVAAPKPVAKEKERPEAPELPPNLPPLADDLKDMLEGASDGRYAIAVGALSEGQGILRSMVEAAAMGRASDTDIAGLATLLTEFQVRLDLGQVGVSVHALKRIERTSSVAEAIETYIESIFKIIPIEMQLKYLAYLQKDRAANMAFVASKSQTPTISSPDNMAGSFEGKAQTAKVVSGLKPESRKRIFAIINKLNARPIDVEVVEG